MGKLRPKDGRRSEGVGSELGLTPGPALCPSTPRKDGPENEVCVLPECRARNGRQTPGDHEDTGVRLAVGESAVLLQQLWAAAILQCHEHLLWASPVQQCLLTNPHHPSLCEGCCHWYRWGGRGHKRLPL